MKLSVFLSRFLACLVACLLVFSLVNDAEAAKKRKRVKGRAAVSQALGVNDPRYAAIIMNPVTGEVYHQQNPDGQRYPASLTKMMTLYLLFEALQEHEIKLSTEMEVSELAASMPQTNLSLDEGDRIDVETAIKALVVRSANDVSVVVAEALGGNVENFARLMTEKAKMLGMRNTVFKNPNGLPNTSQHTTARDMAKLGIALKRDFPKYYPYFSTLQFSHNGVTYYTHNRVLLRYAGVDGIKTGYIGASGFNLVTSVVRGGRPLVGVVMGGGSGAWRDNRMIQLLDETYSKIASRGAARGKDYPSNLPSSKAGAVKPAVEVREESAADSNAPAVEDMSVTDSVVEDDGGASDTLPPATVPATRDEVRDNSLNSPFALAESIHATPLPAATVTPTKPEKTAPVTGGNKSAPKVVRVSPADGGDFNWGIQVGAFSSVSQADQAVMHAMQVAARQLVGAKSVPATAAQSATKIYRARIEHISQTQARRACEALITQNLPCFIYASEASAR